VGGGWINFSKERMAGVPAFLGEHGLAAFSVNHPLITGQPWPACGDACLAAGRFLQEADLDICRASRNAGSSFLREIST
jgi:acetyl esterase/lipase